MDVPGTPGLEGEENRAGAGTGSGGFNDRRKQHQTTKTKTKTSTRKNNDQIHATKEKIKNEQRTHRRTEKT